MTMLDISVNQNLNVTSLGRKPNQSDLTKLNNIGNWQTLVRGAVGEIIETHIKNGNSICGAIKEGGISESNILRVSMLLLDLDNDVDPQKVLDSELVSEYALLVHHTFSSTPEKPRLRVVFVLEDYIDVKLAKATLAKIHREFGIDVSLDKSCIDPGRLYYGSDKQVIYRNFQTRLPTDYALKDVESGLAAEYVLEPTPVSFERLDGIWKIVNDDLGTILSDHNLTISMFFPDIDGVYSITPQRGNVLAQYRGNPTYRESSSGSSFDIFFNDDGSITWCDKSCPQDLKGHFIDYYHRHINGDINFGIPYSDHKAFYDTLGLIYSQCQIEFIKDKYVLLKVEDFDFKELFDIRVLKNGSIKMKPNELKIVEKFMNDFECIYSEADKNVYIWSEDLGYYEKFFIRNLNSQIIHWVRSLFESNLDVYFEHFNGTILSKISNLVKNYLKNAKSFENLPRQDERIIPFANGFYDISKATLIQPSPEYINLYRLPYRYHSTGKALQTFTNLLQSVIADSRQVEDVIKWVACVVALKGSAVNIATGFYGDPGSGKTAITEAILDMVSPARELSKSIDFASALGDRSSYGSSRLLNKKLVCFTELSSFRDLSKSEISRFKDVIAVDKFELNYSIKYGSAGSSMESFAVALTCQDIPEINIEDQGLYRRILWVKIKKSAEDLTEHFDLLKDENFLGDLYSDLLCLDIESFLNYFKNDVTHTEVFKQISHRLTSESDPMIEAIETLLEVTFDPRDKLKSSDINHRFSEYFQVQNIYVRKYDSRLFGKMLKRAIQLTHPTYLDYDNNNRVYKGVRFKS